MKSNKKFFEKFSNKSIFMGIVSIIFLKIIYFCLINFNFFSISLGGGSDANYYHSYAIGEVDVATTIWPEILRWFNDLEIYSRDVTSLILFIGATLVVPYLTVKTTGLSGMKEQKKILGLFFIITMYPTLLFYSTDVFRDIFMVIVYLSILIIIKNIFFCPSIIDKLILILIFIPSIFLLYKLREYLGLSILLSFCFLNFNFTKNRLIIFSLLYLIILFLLNYIGLFSSVTEYREGFEAAGGGSTIGLSFSNPLLFIPNLILSFLAQMFGLYITNPLSLIVFFVESIPFIICFSYIIKNIKYQDVFVRYLLLFFIIYASVWVIGNDNVGTAVRLRMFNYFSIYICAFYIMHKKHSIESKVDL